MSEIPEDVMRLASRAVYGSDGRGMIGRDRDQLDRRVARAIMAERERCAVIADRAGLDIIAEAIRGTS